jgi:hypothetical protein
MSNPPPTSEPEVLPSLDPMTVADDELLGMTVDAVVLGDHDHDRDGSVPARLNIAARVENSG